MDLFQQLTGNIDGVRFFDPPRRVEPGEQFDLIVETRCAAPDEGCAGEPISFYLDGEFWMETTGADIDPENNATAFDGLVDVVFRDSGYYSIRVEVAGQSATQEIAVGREPRSDSDAESTSGTNKRLLAAAGVLGVVAVGSGFFDSEA